MDIAAAVGTFGGELGERPGLKLRRLRRGAAQLRDLCPDCGRRIRHAPSLEIARDALAYPPGASRIGLVAQESQTTPDPGQS